MGYVYSKLNIKQFAVDGFGIAETHQVGPTGEDLLKALAEAYEEIVTANDVHVGDILFLKKGYAEVQKVYQNKEGEDQYGITIGVVYLTGEHQGEEEIRQLPLTEQLTVMRGVRAYKKEAEAQAAEDQAKGIKEEAVKDIKVENVKPGMYLALSKGMAKVKKVDFLENDEGDQRVKLSFEWADGPMTGAESWSSYDVGTIKQVYHIDRD